MSQMTKRALVASLKDLLAEKPLDKITVTDLTEHCGVNRMTFYYHFKDIYDLVEWACIESATRALAGQKTYDTWQQGFLQILQAVQKDKVFVTKVYHSISREHIENYLYRLTYDLMFGVVEEKAAGMTVRPEDKEFIANFYKYAFVGLTLEWVRTGMKDDPAALVERVSVLLHGISPRAWKRAESINSFHCHLKRAASLGPGMPGPQVYGRIPIFQWICREGLRGCERGATVERSETGERAMFAPAGQTTARAGSRSELAALVVRRQALTPPRGVEDAAPYKAAF